jgi:hypothetical protein
LQGHLKEHLTNKKIWEEKYITICCHKKAPKDRWKIELGEKIKVKYKGGWHPHSTSFLFMVLEPY